MPLPGDGACCLSSFNLAEYVKPQDDPGEYYFDYDEFISDIPIVVKAMNVILDEGIPLHPLKTQQETVSKWRQIGIGVLGFHSMLMKLHIKYGSEKSIKLAQSIAKTLLNESILASTELAKEFGAYPAYNYEYISNSKFYQDNVMPIYKEEVEKYGLRNSQLLSIAPTGTISLLLNVSQSSEPIFSKSYTRRTESLHGESVSYKVYDSTVNQIMQDLNITDESDLPDYVITSSEIPYMNRIKMQSAWQQYIDASISSTINLPNTATQEDIYNIYIEAWKAGLKGVTVFRSGCAREGVLTTDSSTTPVHSELKRGDWKPIAKDTLYPKIKLTTGCGKLALFPGWSVSEQKLQEIWIKRKGKGGCIRSIDAIVIEISAILRLGGNLDNISRAFEGLEECKSFTVAKCKGKPLSKGFSCADCILTALQEFESRVKGKSVDVIKLEEDFDNNVEIAKEAHCDVNIIYNACLKCGAELIASGGCFNCPSCGDSKCG